VVLEKKRRKKKDEVGAGCVYPGAKVLYSDREKQMTIPALAGKAFLSSTSEGGEGNVQGSWVRKS